MRFVRPSDSADLERLVEALQNTEPTYNDLGATLAGIRPEGFHHDRFGTVLGRGRPTFERAVHGLKSWEAHRLPGVRVFRNSRSRRVRQWS